MYDCNQDFALEDFASARDVGHSCPHRPPLLLTGHPASRVTLTFAPSLSPAQRRQLLLDLQLLLGPVDLIDNEVLVRGASLDDALMLNRLVGEWCHVAAHIVAAAPSLLP